MTGQDAAMSMNDVGQAADSAPAHPVVLPFLIGAAVGGLAGAVVGTLLSDHMSHAVAALIGLLDRRISSTDRDELRFDLLLQ